MKIKIYSFNIFILNIVKYISIYLFLNMSSFFDVKPESNFLINYIKENEDCPLDDIINDDEFLDLLKYNNEDVYL